MSAILFVALQCFQCSTMQVKQKKKSSNRWVCVICNQKQSVRKVFAQGYKAKELRSFIQSFNMSRKVVDEEEEAIADSAWEVDIEGEIDEDVTGVVRRKKRSDWSEYLDSDSQIDSRRTTGEEDGEEDHKIITELPNDMFKRPKLNKNYNAGGSSSITGGGKKDGDNLFKPSFSRRNTKKPEFGTERVMAKQKVIEERYPELGGVTKQASKWDVFLIDDEGEDQAPPQFGRREALKNDELGEGDKAVMEISSEYQLVDDEVHPDFM